MAWKEVSTVSLRLEFVKLVLANGNISKLCREFGISRKTGYKWLRRYQENGAEGLQDRSRRPHTSPNRTPAEMERRVLALRDKQPAWGDRKISRILQNEGVVGVPPPSTITEILRRHGRIDPEESRKHRPWQRFEAEAPNKLWQMDGGAGTLGAFVELEDGRPALLSNNHVMALFNYAETDDYIYQPGRQDVLRQLARNRIARLYEFVPLSRTQRNHVDSAIAVIRDDISFNGNIVPTGLRHPKQGKMLKLGDPLSLTAGTVVSKIGRTTGFRQGLVKAIALDNVSVRTPIGNLMFDDTIEIEWLPDKKPFSKPGDSGSVVFVEDDLSVIGLHFAGGHKQNGARRIGVSYSCNIRTVLKDYGVSLM
jgi:transposase